MKKKAKRLLKKSFLFYCISIFLACHAGAAGSKLKAMFNLSSPSIKGQFILSVNSGLSVNEANGTTSFTIQLSQKPSANVYLNSITISRTDKASLSQGNLVFTPSNWNTPTNLTVTGIPNNVIDGNQNWTIYLGKATSSDLNFDGVDAGNVTGITIDNDAFGMTVSPTTGLTTSNGGGSTTFTVVLNKAASGSFSVSIPITVSNSSIATVSPATVNFTDTNWNQPQTVTVTGTITGLSPGNQSYTIDVGATISSNSSLSGFSTTLSAINIDSNASKFDITPTSGLVTSKAGATATIQFRLTSAPSSNVQITVSSSNTSQATVSTSFLVFTTSNWNTFQIITVTGVNNNQIQGNQPFSVVFGAASGGGITGITPASISGTNTDTNTAGFQLSTTTVSANEGSSTSTVTIKLNTIPTANVILTLTSSDTVTGGTVLPATLTFTPANWNTNQNINITTVVRDNAQTANVGYTISISAASADTNYNALSAGPINATKVNIDTRGYTVSQTSNFYVSGAGSVATFNVKLNTQPVGGNVVIPITNYNTSKATVSPATLTFTSANWNTNQTITITALNDGSSGISTFQIQLGGGATPFYPSAGADDYSTNNVSIGDWNGASSGNINIQYNGIGGGNKLVAIIPPGTAMQVTEGGTFNYYLNLSQSPTATVTTPLTTSDSTRATITASLSLTSGNYNSFVPATKATVTGVSDYLITGNTTITIQHGVLSSADAFFNTYSGSGQDFTITAIDNDTFGTTKAQSSGTTNLVTEYSGTNNTATYLIKLNARPNSGQTCSFNITSSDTTAATISPASMTFDNMTWATNQTLTVTGVAGPALNYNRSFSIQFSNTTSGQSQFNNQAISSIAMSVVSNAIVVGSPTPDSNTSVTGTTRTFTVVLNSPPTANVNIPLASSDTQAGTVSPASLTFTTVNWNTPQTVTVTGVNPSPIQNGSVAYQINLGPSTSGDAKYNGITPTAVSMTNLDY